MCFLKLDWGQTLHMKRTIALAAHQSIFYQASGTADIICWYQVIFQVGISLFILIFLYLSDIAVVHCGFMLFLLMRYTYRFVFLYVLYSDDINGGALIISILQLFLILL